MPHDRCIRLGVDIGGTHTRIGYVHEGELKIAHRFSTNPDPARQTEVLVSHIRNARLPGELCSIGVGCPGPLDPIRGVIQSPPNLPQWDEFHLRDELAGNFGVEVQLENDANAGALGEACFGAGREFRTVYYLTLSTGIGSGLVTDGSVYNTSNGLAGEVWAFAPDLFLSDDRSRNLMDIASGPGMVREAHRLIRDGFETSISEITTAEISRQAQSDPLAAHLTEKAIRYISSTIVFVLTLLAPDIVVLGGGLCTDPSWLVEPIASRVKATAPIKVLQKTPIRRAELWDTAVLYGATVLQPCEVARS